ncbi:hypothetical protein PRIPAC_87275 [Pristionchus pacificus]|uniref:Uncharacterized protein n=1 Tax=Pristionchus pacificus TaxID=54126 RepID=A0A454XU02_PRIPA|nr:hypothetical protein PRIPAC_87275 [Pristionchus pacificus]|eukprot:PDM61534.1 hypothetical protein PRIPAC_50976 [Pristionchus pacificus]
MDPRDSDLPDHPEDPYPPADQQVPPPADEDAEDFVEDEHEEDDEATLDEEEAMLEDDDDELDDLEAEADMDIEELRKKYGYGAPAPSEDEPGISSVADEAEEEEEEELEVPFNNEVIMQQQHQFTSKIAIESAANNYFGVAENNEAEEEDVDYEPPEKKEFQIRVDPLLYQAAVPESIEGVTPSAEAAEHPAGTLLWAPREDLPDESLNRFVHEWKARRHGVETDETKIDSRDDEDALYALLSSAYSTDAAAAHFPFEKANEFKRTCDGESKPFTTEEMAAFETGFKDNYKNFRVIREHFVPSRTHGELINYYYHWKMSSRFNELFRQRQMRKDFMTEVMDQMESTKRRRVEPSSTTTSSSSTVVERGHSPDGAPSTVIHSENYDDEVEYEDPLAGAGDEPPVDVWAAPPPPQIEQPTESA